MNEQDRKGLNKWMAIFNEVDAERGKADQDDMNWWRDTSTSLDENVRVRVYDWDADATDTLTMTRRCAIMEGHITPTEKEVELLAAEGFVLRAGTALAPTPASAPAPAPGLTLGEAIEQYGDDLSGVEVTNVWGERIARCVRYEPCLSLAECIIVTPSGKETAPRKLMSSMKVSVNRR
jgi:hypothetical protein